jgi:molybdopterin-guanine dinucleotide biosynthesis protein A
MEGKEKLAFSAVILNGGQGVRFGGIDKQLLEIDGVPIGFALAKTLVQSCEEVLIVGKKNAIYKPLEVQQIEDAVPGLGPAGGLLAGMMKARADWIYLCAVDMPFFSYSLSKYMYGKALSKEADIIVCQYKGEFQPFFAFYRKSLAGALASFVTSGAKPSLKRFISSRSYDLVSLKELQDIGEQEAIFCNINNSGSLDAARQIALEHGLFIDTRL